VETSNENLIAQIWRYPVKSLRGELLSAVAVN
jgi:uncharacterized protein YcbX